MTDLKHALGEFQIDVFGQIFERAHLSFTLSDPNAEDDPLVFCNDAFLDLTGYNGDQVLGRNCRFLQGKDTEQGALDAIRAGIKERIVTTAEFVNYRRSGSSFMNALQIGPIRDDSGALTYFFGSQMDVSVIRETEAQIARTAGIELQHRLLNIVNVLSTMVRMTAREKTDEAVKFQRIEERISAVGKAHLFALTNSDADQMILRDVAHLVLDAYSLNGSDDLDIDGPDVPLSQSVLTTISLVLHELGTNAVKHGALGQPTGNVSLQWDVTRNTQGNKLLSMHWQESGGPPVKIPDRESGSKLVTDILQASGGKLDFNWKPEGLVATATLPLP